MEDLVLCAYRAVLVAVTSPLTDVLFGDELVTGIMCSREDRNRGFGHTDLTGPADMNCVWKLKGFLGADALDALFATPPSVAIA